MTALPDAQAAAATGDGSGGLARVAGPLAECAGLPVPEKAEMPG